jgi:hypothetical protein
MNPVYLENRSGDRDNFLVPSMYALRAISIMGLAAGWAFVPYANWIWFGLVSIFFPGWKLILDPHRAFLASLGTTWLVAIFLLNRILPLPKRRPFIHR